MSDRQYILRANKHTLSQLYATHGLGAITRDYMKRVVLLDGVMAILNAVNRGAYDIDALDVSRDVEDVNAQCDQARAAWWAYVDEEPGDAYTRICALPAS